MKWKNLSKKRKKEKLEQTIIGWSIMPCPYADPTDIRTRPVSCEDYCGKNEASVDNDRDVPCISKNKFVTKNRFLAAIVFTFYRFIHDYVKSNVIERNVTEGV